MHFEIPYLAGQPEWVQAAAGLLFLVLLAYLGRLIAQVILLQGVGRAVAKTPLRLLHVLLNQKVLSRLAKIVPSLIIQMTVAAVPHLHPDLATLIRNLAMAFTVLHATLTLMALLDGIQDDYDRERIRTGKSTRSIKSYIELGKLGLALIGIVIMIGALMDRSPLILLSGVGAMSAVLLLVFKDTLLSFTAGMQLSTNDLLRVGDWIEMPQLGADGAVIDIALHTVKVQNWDKTITTIPTWRLMSESFRNWRGMQESGGRRIKRTLRLDAASIRFLTPEDVVRLRDIAILRPYLEAKLRDVEGSNQELLQRLGELAKDPANQRRLTNVGTFRAYANAYIDQHAGVNKEMLKMVRTMEPSSDGVPMEVYCFADTVAWVEYEGVQGDIFDHLLAILPEFGLRLYQKPSGHDVTAGLYRPAEVMQDARNSPAEVTGSF